MRYKRTVFPTHLTCTWHELAALGTHGRHAIWIEGDGPPPEEDLPPVGVVMDVGAVGRGVRDESAELRVLLAGVGDRNDRATAPREVVIPPSVRAQLGRVSCVAVEDSVGMLALATLDGRIILLEFT